MARIALCVPGIAASIQFNAVLTMPDSGRFVARVAVWEQELCSLRKAGAK